MASVSTTEAPIRPRNILQLSTIEKRQFLDSFDHIFSDIDGVVWNFDGGIEGAPQGFIDLQHAGKKVTFITNNSVRLMSSCKQKFKAVGLDVDENDIVHPAKSIVEYLQSIKFDGLIYIIATETVKNIIKEAGFKIIDGPTEILEESVVELLRHAFDSQPVRAVIIDVDINLSSTKLIRAQNYLRNPECLLIAGATDMLIPVTSNICILGPGQFSTIVANVSKQEMIALGKPGKHLAEMLIKRHDIRNTNRALMIGDMLAQDVGFGKQCGFQTLIVLSGGCTLEELQAETNPQLLPDYYAESMADFVEFMKDLNKAHV